MNLRYWSNHLVLNIIYYFGMISIEFRFVLIFKFFVATIQIDHALTLLKIPYGFLITLIPFLINCKPIIQALLTGRRKVANKLIKHGCMILCVLLQLILWSHVLLWVFDLDICLFAFQNFTWIVFIDLIFGINLTCFDLPLKFCHTVDLDLHFSKLLHIFQLASLSILNHLSLLFQILGTFRMLLLPFTGYACLIRIDLHVSKIHKIVDLRLCF